MTHRLLAAGGLVLASLLLTGACLELGFRWIWPQRADGASMYTPHPELGWSFVQNRRSAVVLGGVYAHYVHTNAHGFRDAPFEPLPPGSRRVAVLGDSFVSNLAVAREEVFTERMERSLPGVSVMNLGVDGYGTVQEALLLEHVLRSFDPDLVLVMVYLRNDFTDNTGAPWSATLARPSATLEESGGGVQLRAPPAAGPEPAPPEAALSRLHLVHFLRKRLAFLRERGAAAPGRKGRFRPSRATPPELYLAALDPDSRTQELYELMRRMLLRIDGRGREAGVPVVFVLAPSLVQVLPELWERVLEEHAAEAADFDLTLPNRRLLEVAGTRGLRMLDLLPPLRRAHERGESTYSLAHHHWTPGGNRVVAKSLLDFLREDPALQAALMPAQP